MRTSSGVRCFGTSNRMGLNKVPTATFVILAALMLLSPCANAQNYLTSTGSPSFSAPEPVELGFADTANGNLHLTFHLGSYPQRGSSKPEEVNLIYDSNFWQITYSGGNVWDPGTGRGSDLNSQGGWNLSEQILSRQVGGSTLNCREDDVWQDRNGTQHVFDLATNTFYSGCPLTASAYAADSSGYWMTTSYNGQGGGVTAAIYAPDGTLVYSWPQALDSLGHIVIAKDSNGNYLSMNSSYTGFYDTIGRDFVQASGTLTSPTYTVTTSQGPSAYQVTGTSITLNTNFQKSGVSECKSPYCTMYVIQSITLPDQTKYTFTYDCDSSTGNPACGSPSGQTYYYGELMSVTLPTGGKVSYTYTMFKDAYGNNTRWLSSRYGTTSTYYTPSVLSTCSSSQVGCQQQVSVLTYGTGTKVYTFTLNNGAWPVSVIAKDQSGNVLSTTANTWDFSQSCVLLNCHGASYIRLLSQKATVYAPSGALTKQTSYTYDSPQKGNITAVKQWAYYPGTSPSFPSTPDRATYISYLTTGTNDINRPQKVTGCNNSGSDTTNCPGGGSRVSQTVYTYDIYGSGGCPSLATISGTANHDDTIGSGYTTRGNPTQIQRWVSGSTTLNTQLCYDTTGQVVEAIDPAGNQTTYNYADNYFTETGAASMSSYTPSAPTNAIPKTITEGGLTWTFGYYYGSGKRALSTDPNNQTTSSYNFDWADRPTETVFPIGWKLATYTSPTAFDSYIPVGDTSASSGCSSCRHNEVTLDILGRKINEKLVNAPSGAINVDTAYDIGGRIQSVSHPYVGSSNGSEVFGYDALNRQLSVTHPDGQSIRTNYGAFVNSEGGATSQSSTSYGYGYPVISVDETLKQRQQWINGFGQIVEADEPSVSAGTPGSTTIGIGFNSSQVSTTWNPCLPYQGNCPQTVYNSGTITITVDGFATQAYYSYNSTVQALAAALASGLNGPTSPVTATSNSNGTITITALGPGSDTNFAFSTSATYNTQTCGQYSCFSGPEFYGSPSSGALAGGSGGISSSPVPTYYSYDAAGNLTMVVQGLQTRTFTHDGLGRLTSRTTPEAGTDYFYFTKADGVSLCAGSPKAVCRRTDARGITTTYTYNSRSQLTGKSYSNGQGSVTYQYDQGGAGAFALGRLTSTTDPSGSETYTYNSMGWVTRLQKTIGTSTYPINYSYNTGGQVTQITYPSGRIVQQNVDNIGLLNTIISGGTTYVSIPEPPTGYNAAGQILTYNYGNGVTANFGFSSATRDQMTSLSYVKGSATLFSLNYGYMNGQANCGTGTTAGNDGLIQCVQDTVDNGRSVVYGYDALNRLTSAVTTGSSGYAKWGLSESFDRYGNRLNQTVTAGTAPPNSLTFATTPTPPANPPGGAYTNRPDGYSFDASGNMLNDASNNLAYDDENCLTSAGTTTYTCDVHGWRVVKALASSTNTAYIFSAGKDIAEYDYTSSAPSPSSPSREYIYLGGKLIATIQGTSTVYHHADHLSVRVTTDANGNKIGEQGHYPYGETWYTSGTTTKFIFTSYERDPESGNDYAMARYYISRFGRFSCVDPSMGTPSDPQSWNRYVYVRNNPTNMVDPSGRFVEFLAFLVMAIVNALGGLDAAGTFDHTGPTGTPPIFDGGPFSGTTATLNSIYNPIDPSPYIISEAGGFGGVSANSGSGSGDSGDEGGGAEGDPARNPIDFGPVKAALETLFTNNPGCAGLLGGPDNAKRLLQQMRLIDVPQFPYAFGTSQSSDAAWKDISASNAGGNNLLAETSWSTISRNSGAWNGNPYTTFVGDRFANFDLSQQEGVLVHEMVHPYTGYGGHMAGQPGEGNPVDNLDMYSPYGGISDVCGTEKPWLK